MPLLLSNGPWSSTPTIIDIHVLAAQAWGQAGNAEKATEHWKSVDGQSIPLALARTDALLRLELVEPPAQQDFSDVRNACDQIQRMINQLSEESAAEKGRFETQLEVLRLMILEPGSNRDAAFSKLEKLAEAHPTDAEVQSTAALTLAAANLGERTAPILDRLRAIETDEASWIYADTHARVLALLGKGKEAIESLTAYAKANPKQALDALSRAAEMLKVQEMFAKRPICSIKFPVNNKPQNCCSVTTPFSSICMKPQPRPRKTLQRNPLIQRPRTHSLRNSIDSNKH